MTRIYLYSLIMIGLLCLVATSVTGCIEVKQDKPTHHEGNR